MPKGKPEGYRASGSTGGGSVGGGRGGGGSRGGGSRVPNLLTSKTKNANRMDPVLRKLALERNDLVPSKRRLGSVGRATAKMSKQYSQNVKRVVKDPATRAADPSIMRAVNRRGGTRPYSKMTLGTMSKAPTKPSTGGMSSRYAGKMKSMGKKAK